MSETTTTTGIDKTGSVTLQQVETKKTNEWNSKKLFVVLLNLVVVGWLGHIHSLEGMWLALCLSGPTMIFLGGQSLIDAVEKFATAKFGA